MPTTLTIRKALTVKNRLVKEVKELQERIVNNNITREGVKVPYSARETLKTLDLTVAKLTELKTAIQKSNTEIYFNLCAMEELKSRIAFFRTIPIDERDYEMQSQGYGKEPIKVVISCSISTVERDTVIRLAESQIESLQDAVDQHNANAKVTVSFEI
jgi:hypothetical protein